MPATTMLPSEIFKAYDIRGLYPGEINDEVARLIGRGFVSYLGAKHIGVSRDSKKADAAWKWIEFLSEPDNMATWTYKAEGSTLLPPRKSLLESPDLVKEK